MTILQRRHFITLLGGAAAWPVVAQAQQPGGRMRRIGMLLPGDENDPLRKTYVSVLTQALAGLGWTDGRNVRIDLRWTGRDGGCMSGFMQPPRHGIVPLPRVEN